jgi:hypothetical protein
MSNVNIIEKDESPPVFTPEMLNAWDEVVRRHNEGVPAKEKGQPDSIEDFRKRLAPFRETIKEPLERLLKTVPAFKELRVYNRQDFWRRNPNGALFQSHIRVVVAQSQDKTLGRLQLTLCPGRFVRCEYVANIATDQNREFQIERISERLRQPEWFSEFQRGCLELGYCGFRLQCTCGNDESIDAAFPDITEQEWDSLRLNGLDCSEYFLIKYDRPFFPIRELSVDELAQLAVSDWSELSGLYLFLQEDAKTIGTGTPVAVSDTVQRARRNATPPRPVTFAPEFVGQRAEYENTGSVQSESTHGAVVNALFEELDQLGHVVVNDQQRDAFIVGKNGEVTVLFEAKTDLSPYSVYTAVGQLILHSVAQNPLPKRVLVAPGQPKPSTRDLLARLEIEVLEYIVEDDRIRFKNIAVLGLSDS